MVDDQREEFLQGVVEKVDFLLKLLLNGEVFSVCFDYDVVGLFYLEDEVDCKYYYFFIDFYFDNDVKDGVGFF